MLASLLSRGISRAGEPVVTESSLEAAFLFNFAKFVDWPPTAYADATTPITIGILTKNAPGGKLDDNSIAKDLEAIVLKREINGRAIIVKQLTSVAEVTNFNCQMLYFGGSHLGDFKKDIIWLGKASVLLVGHADHFADRETGGMINFVKQGSKIRFQINEAAAKNAGLKISSKLLSLGLPIGQ